MKSSEKVIKIKNKYLPMRSKKHVFSLKKGHFSDLIGRYLLFNQTHFILISFFVSLPFSLIVLTSLKCTFTKPAETLDQVTPQGFWIQK